MQVHAEHPPLRPHPLSGELGPRTGGRAEVEHGLAALENGKPLVHLLELVDRAGGVVFLFGPFEVFVLVLFHGIAPSMRRGACYLAESAEKAK